MEIKKALLVIALLAELTICIAQDPNQQVNLFAIPTMSAAFIRNPSRAATTDVDAVFYNPAGLTQLKDGFSLSINNQFQWTEATMKAHNKNINESPGDYSYAPINYAFPTVFGAYKRNRFAFSFGAYPAIGGGGATSIANLPSVEFPVADAAVLSRNIFALLEDAYGLENTYTNFVYDYDFNSRGVAFSPGFQVGFSFQINDYISIALAGRYVYYIVDQDGGLDNLRYINEDLGVELSVEDYFNYMDESEPTLEQALTLEIPGPLPDIELPFSGSDLLGVGELFGSLLGSTHVDVIQSSSGITPIIGMNINWHNRWNIGLKYEHKTYINLVTKITDGKDGGGLYVEGKEVRADLPGFLSSGVSFKPNNKWTISAGNRLFFNKRADLNGREQYIKTLYKEFDVSLEYNVRPRITVSGGATYRSVQYEDEYYTDVDYYLPAWTFAAGFRTIISPRISFEAGFLTTLYTDKIFHKDYEVFGGQLAQFGLELPDALNDALNQNIKYEVDGKALVAAVGVNFWMGSIEQNRRDRTERVEQLKEKRQVRRAEIKAKRKARRNDEQKSDPE